MAWAKVGGRDEGVRVQGDCREKLGEALAIPLATVSRASDYPQSTFAIVLLSRRPVDPGFGFPRAV
ncbi:MAG: hypothetical protein NTV68_00390 [Methanomicrobiales archaeon]|nr:hypothetical protein [Methanomicrobiales archaeon]